MLTVTLQYINTRLTVDTDADIDIKIPPHLKRATSLPREKIKY